MDSVSRLPYERQGQIKAFPVNYDVIVIGSGAGGCAAAYRLVKAGKKVLLVEKGKALPSDGSTLDFRKVIESGVFKSKEPWLDRNDRRFVPEEYFNLGGKTKWYGAALLRFDRSEFEPQTGFKCLGWPLSYRDLEPYYAEAEALLGVRCFDVEPDLKNLLDRINRQESGWRSRPLPLALNPAILDEALEVSHFDGFASCRGLKADGEHVFLKQIQGAGNFELITGQVVARLIADPSDPLRIAGVELEDGRHCRAGGVVLAAGALHSPRLLQDYLEFHGLAARLPCAKSVGRYFKRHLLTAMMALSPGKKSDRLRKTVLWLNDEFPHGSIQPLGFGEDVLSALIPGFLPRRMARPLAARAYGFFLQTEDGSDADNRIYAAGSNGEARWPKLDYDPERFPELMLEHERMIRSFRRTLRRAGCLSFIQSVPLAGTAHACGTLLAGEDPVRSVVDRNGKVHGLNNLYVADGSILPRSSRVNPALTIYAWALRTADHIAERIPA